MYRAVRPEPNYFRLRHQPGHHRSPSAMNVIAPDQETESASPSRAGVRSTRRATEMDAYERLLGDAMEGDATLFARRGLRRGGVAHRRSGAEGRDAGLRIRAAAPGDPSEVEQSVSPPGGWHDPAVTSRRSQRGETMHVAEPVTRHAARPTVPSTRSARSRSTRCSRPSPAIPARRWRSRRWSTRSGTA